jgi:hypothetical protein
MSSTTDVGSTHRVSLSLNCSVSVPIDIFRNSVWAGSGYVKNGRISDCVAAQLGRNGEETEAIYEAIEGAIANNETSLVWSREAKLKFTWHLGQNGF